MPGKPDPNSIRVDLTVVEALALIKAADMGEIIYREAALVKSTATMKAAVEKVRRALPAR